MADAAGERRKRVDKERMWHPRLSHVRATTTITTMADAVGERRKRAASPTLPRQSNNSNNNNIRPLLLLDSVGFGV